MKERRSIKTRLIASVLTLVMIVSALIGTTFAWFTDSATSGGNVIQSGNLDAEMYWSETLLAADSSEWENANGVPVFTYDKWEPGYTDVKYIKVENAGDLSFKWQLSIIPNGEVGKLAEVIDVYYVNPVSSEITTLAGIQSAGVLSEVIENRTSTNGILLPDGETSNEYAVGDAIIAIAFHMDENAGNEYKETSVGDFSLKLIATQFTYESDSFGNGYDTNAQWPDNVVIGGNSASADVSVENNLTTSATTMTSSIYTKISRTTTTSAIIGR